MPIVFIGWGDADFVNVPKNLLAEGYAKSRIQGVDLNKPKSAVKFGLPEHATEAFFNKHTTHIATAGKAGNWVAITTTLNTRFGRKVVIPRTGVLMNNQMDDFSAPAALEKCGFGLSDGRALAPLKLLRCRRVNLLR